MCVRGIVGNNSWERDEEKRGGEEQEGEEREGGRVREREKRRQQEGRDYVYILSSSCVGHLARLCTL